ncbi:MAG: hypothetical protein IT292_04165 [Deltaproteobacteria bacterium]|nr:hypothetical protein [Deltaproteobacteria bacterium]
MRSYCRRKHHNLSAHSADTFITSYLTLIIILVGVFVYLTSGAEINLTAVAAPVSSTTNSEEASAPVFIKEVYLPQIFAVNNKINSHSENLLKLISSYARARNLTIIGEINFPANQATQLAQATPHGEQTAILWQYFQRHGIRRNNSFFMLTPARSAIFSNMLAIKLYKNFPTASYPL